MAVLVTGSAGFVGVNVVQALLERGDEVLCFDTGDLPAPAAAALKAHARRLTVATGNVLDAGALDRAIGSHKVDRIVHTAAVTSGPKREAADPAAIVDVNVNGTINVLTAARRHGVQRVVHLSSGAAYGETLYRLDRIYEDSPSAPLSLYGITKYAAERTVLRLKALWEIDVVCARLGTVIGPWERATSARDNYGTHTQLAVMAREGRTAILTPREVRRDWVYSADVAAGLLVLLDAPVLHHGLYHLTHGTEWPGAIAAWCEALRAAYPAFDYRVAGAGEEPNIWYTDRDRGIMDVGRITQDTGFAPRHGMGESYDAFIDWLRRTPAV